MPEVSKVAMSYGEYEIVEILDKRSGSPQYCATKDGEPVTKRYPTPEAVKTELELMQVAMSLADNPWIAPDGGLLQRFVLYPIGRAMLLALTMGRYPPSKRHDSTMVAAFPIVVVCLVLVAINH